MSAWVGVALVAAFLLGAVVALVVRRGVVDAWRDALGRLTAFGGCEVVPGADCDVCPARRRS